MGLRRTPGAAAVYRDPRWAVARLAAKRRDGWKCVQCGARGRLEVDHVRGLRDGGEPFDLANLQTLCPACHSRKTRVEIGLGRADPERDNWAKLLKTPLS